MNSSMKRRLRLGLVIFFVAAIFWSTNRTVAADGHTPFEGEKTTWHGGFDRYDFIMDDATGAITPMKAAFFDSPCCWVKNSYQRSHALPCLPLSGATKAMWKPRLSSSTSVWGS